MYASFSANVELFLFRYDDLSDFQDISMYWQNGANR